MSAFKNIAPYFNKQELLSSGTLFKMDTSTLEMAEISEKLVSRDFSRYGFSSRKVREQSGQTMSPTATRR